jgi:hypothetical protein
VRLIFCRRCSDVITVSRIPHLCACGATAVRAMADGTGVYHSDDDAAVPIAIDDASLAAAIQARPLAGDGAPFTACVLPEFCPVMIKAGTDEAAEAEESQECTP